MPGHGHGPRGLPSLSFLGLRWHWSLLKLSGGKEFGISHRSTPCPCMAQLVPLCGDTKPSRPETAPLLPILPSCKVSNTGLHLKNLNLRHCAWLAPLGCCATWRDTSRCTDTGDTGPCLQLVPRFLPLDAISWSAKGRSESRDKGQAGRGELPAEPILWLCFSLHGVDADKRW